MRWLIDYDSTLANTLRGQLRLVNERFGRNYTEDIITAWRTEDCLPEKEVGFMWGSECFGNLEFQAQIEPVTGAIEGLLALVDSGEHCMIISDRAPALFEVTRNWLDEKGLDMVRLLFTHHKLSARVNKDGAMSKYQAAWVHRLNTVVEDSPFHAEVFGSKTWVNQVYLLDKPYNRHVEGEKILRVSNWNEILDHVGII